MHCVSTVKQIDKTPIVETLHATSLRTYSKSLYIFDNQVDKSKIIPPSAFNLPPLILPSSFLFLPSNNGGQHRFSSLVISFPHSGMLFFVGKWWNDRGYLQWRVSELRLYPTCRNCCETRR